VNDRTRTALGIALTALMLSPSTGCTYRVSLPLESHDFVGFEDSHPEFVIVAEPYLSPTLNQRVFQADLPTEGILPIQLSITNVSANVLTPAAHPRLQEPGGAVWRPVPARDVAKQIRRSATMHGLMAKTPFLGLLAAPFGLVLAPIIGGTAELMASHSTTEANDDMSDDVVGLAFRRVAIAPGDTYRAFAFFHVPAPARMIDAFTALILALPIEDVSVRRTIQAAITIRPPVFYTRATIWDRSPAGSAPFVPPASPVPATVAPVGLQAGPAHMDAGTHYAQAVADAQNGRRDIALEALDRAIRTDVAHGEAFWGRGVLRARQGQYAEATADLTRAIELGLRLADIHNYRGLLYARQRQDDLAAQDWDTAAVLSPNFPLPLYNRGTLSWIHSRPESAKADFAAACNLGFEPACLSVRDLETHWPCCPPGTAPLSASRPEAPSFQQRQSPSGTAVSPVR